MPMIFRSPSVSNHRSPDAPSTLSVKWSSRSAVVCAVLSLASASWTAASAAEPRFPITAEQRGTANQVAQAGVPLSELAPNAPDTYTIKRGDTLWDISALFLKSPWRWPELWGMNLQDIRNPHLIYPGQVLYLIKANGRATLSTRPGGDVPTVKLQPTIRAQALAASAIPPISPQDIEPFLAQPLIVDEATFSRAPRIVATQEGRVLLSRGDRAYARAQYGNGDAPVGPTLSDADGQREYRVFRNATPLKDPRTGEVLGYEAQFVGQALVERSEGTRTVTGADGQVRREIVPATIDIVMAKEEIRVGDRLIAEPPREVPVYVPRAPGAPTAGQVVSVHGNAVTFAGQKQVVVINRGARDGLERGHVLAILKDSSRLPDRTDSAQPMLQLPGERNGLMMVFRTFDRLSYALVLEITDGVKVGDSFVNP